MRDFQKNIKLRQKGNKNLFLLPCLVILSYALNIPVFAFDVSDFGDFSSRSIIESQIFKKNSLTKEQNDLLRDKKLVPTPECLFRQVNKGDIENVKLLLDAKVNPNESYMAEYSIYIASKNNNFEILKLLYENGAKLDRGYNSELYEALRNKNTEMAQYLLDRGANINFTDHLTNNTILYMSLKNKMYDLSSQIISKGAFADNRSVKYIKKNKLEYLIPASSN